jgi:hypothetical protein
MSWLCSQALVAEYSEATCWDGAPSAPLSVMPTPHKFWRNDKMMDVSRLSQFGLTCAVLTEDRGEDLLTWFRADFLARTSARPAQEKGLTASAPASGGRWPESSVRFDPVSSSWKTAHCLWEEVLPWSSVTLPKWGMTRSGVVCRHPTAERPISAIEHGLWPTPTVCGNNNKPGSSKKAGWGLATAVKQWTTPSASDARRGGTITAGMSGSSLVQQVNTPEKWPTPVTRGLDGGSHSRAALKKRKWPTPVASMAKGSSPGALTRKSGADRSNDRLDHAVMDSDGGQLNPAWVEWLMGWPIGWTELKPLAMARFQEWQQQHGKYYPDCEQAA